MKVLKWDDDLAVLLPEELVKQMGLEAGDELRIVEAAWRASLEEYRDIPFMEDRRDQGDG